MREQYLKLIAKGFINDEAIGIIKEIAKTTFETYSPGIFSPDEYEDFYTWIYKSIGTQEK